MGSDSVYHLEVDSEDERSIVTIADYCSINEILARELTEDEMRTIVALAYRQFHLPNQSYWQDLRHYLVNNHPLFGLCFHHKLHPLRVRDRIMMLLGSISFGLAATSGVVVWFWHNQWSMDETYASYSFQLPLIGNVLDVTITKGMISLWLFGGPLHSMFDITIWYAESCPCCQHKGGLRDTRCGKHCGLTCMGVGTHIATVAVTIATILAGVVVFLRATEIEDENKSDYIGFEDLHFTTVYLIELIFALFIFYPLVAFVLFSGVLGCGFLPTIGGRPWDKRRKVKMWESKKLKELGVYKTGAWI